MAIPDTKRQGNKEIGRVFKYKVTEIFLEIPDMDPIEIQPSKLTEIEIIHDYDNCYFPVIRVSLDVSLKELYLIRKNSENAKLYFRLLTDDNFYGKSTSITEEVIKKKFTIYLDDATPELQKKLNEIAANMKNEMVNMQSRMEFCIFDADVLYKSRNQINTILYNSNLTSAITYMLQKLNITNVLLSPLDNTKVYNIISIPPADFLRAMVNLERTYGLYKTFMTLYFDLNRLYIIDKKPEATALENGEREKITIYISRDDEANAYVPISVLEEKEYILYTNIKNFSFNENTNTNDGIVGNKATLINLGDGNVSNINPELKSVHGQKINTISTTNYTNNYLNEALKFQREEDTTEITITTRDIDINYITPNKSVSLIFNDTQLHNNYGGAYRIVKCHVLLTREDEDMNNVTNITLRKYKNTEE